MFILTMTSLYCWMHQCHMKEDLTFQLPWLDHLYPLLVHLSLFSYLDSLFEELIVLLEVIWVFLIMKDLLWKYDHWSFVVCLKYLAQAPLVVFQHHLIVLIDVLIIPIFITKPLFLHFYWSHQFLIKFQTKALANHLLLYLCLWLLYLNLCHSFQYLLNHQGAYLLHLFKWVDPFHFENLWIFYP